MVKNAKKPVGVLIAIVFRSISPGQKKKDKKYITPFSLKPGKTAFLFRAPKPKSLP
jgi:hypothetical protein